MATTFGLGKRSSKRIAKEKKELEEFGIVNCTENGILLKLPHRRNIEIEFSYLKTSTWPFSPCRIFINGRDDKYWVFKTHGLNAMIEYEDISKKNENPSKTFSQYVREFLFIEDMFPDAQNKYEGSLIAEMFSIQNILYFE